MSRIRRTNPFHNIESFEIDLDNSDFTNWTGDPTDLFRSPFSASISNTTADNPKQITLAFGNTVQALQIGLGENNGGDFSNVKISLLGSGGAVREIFDDSTNNTKLTSLNAEFTNELFNSVLLEFHTADPVSISNLAIVKATYATVQIQGEQDNGDFNPVALTNRGHLKVSIDEYGDTPSVDAFGRLRISNPAQIWENVFEYDLNPIRFSNSTSGAGTITHLPDESAAQLSTGGTASGDKAILQTKKYHRYQSGLSFEIFMTGTLGDPKANVRQRYGYFDDANGIFFEQDENGKYIVRRSSTSGSPVEERVPQANWNIDKFDGTGVSGVDVDFSKAQIFFIDFQWLGSGRVRAGFDINGKIHVCHEFITANVSDTVFMSTPNLPLRSEIENTGVAASATTMKQFCHAIHVEGGRAEDRGREFSVSRGITPLGVTTRRPVLSIRPSPTFNGITNRGHVTFEELVAYATTNNAYWEIIIGGTLGGASWVNVNPTYSIADYDISATTISGGIRLTEGHLLSGLGTSSQGTDGDNLPIELFNDFAGTTPDILSFVATSFSGTSNVNATLRWTEQR